MMLLLRPNYFLFLKFLPVVNTCLKLGSSYQTDYSHCFTALILEYRFANYFITRNFQIRQQGSKTERAANP